MPIATPTATGLSRLADFLLPPVCLACGQGVAEHGTLCGACWSEAAFIEEPRCRVTGLPFAYRPGGAQPPEEEMVSAVALAHPPAYCAARAAMQYNDLSRLLISRFKYGDRLEGAPAFAKWMMRAGADLVEGADLIVPVPLHRARLFSRRFNQSAELARWIGRLSGVPFDGRTLLRVRATRPQVGLSGAARRRNLRGAFKIAEARRAGLQGRCVVVVDDVITSGSTVEACARALVGAGAAEVRVLALARVVTGEGAII
ncbi:ComF family protein [Parvibaculum indicum]|uniref:ComF family protein n=1 Tax=Parvibaculum indicum TaxID=562969 RepID=UPI001420D9CC|nr:ComF family protein [Parvibaculum indicum]NIJ42297.1 ComF family protein [Parvibaculum indicum]